MDLCSIFLNLQNQNIQDLHMDLQDIQFFTSTKTNDEVEFDNFQFKTPKKIKLNSCEKTTQQIKDLQSIEKVLLSADQLKNLYFSESPGKMYKIIPIEKLKISIDSNQHQKLSPDKNLDSLALRNLKLNLGTGLNQFVQFKKELALLNRDYPKFHIFNDLNNFLQPRLNKIRSQQGWIDLWSDPDFGELIRNLSLQFFGQNYSRSYIMNSKIKKEYKKAYMGQINAFYLGAKNPIRFSEISSRKLQ